MSSNQHNLETLLAEAVEIEKPDERDAYLQRICAGKPTQLSELQSMVHDYFAAGSLIDRPVALMSTLDASPPEKIGTRIGPYKLLEPIGEGGMGVVYMAEQSEPVRRLVALKVIKPGMDTRQVIVRFEAERQALALMEHPNIARVLDAGATESDRPYFVMELVKGIPITDYCDQVRLPTRQRLELFIDVCRAVQHAHQKGIIHRDLKPSNVMITLYDGTPVVKVIDFGIAKATGQQLTEKTLFTGFGQLIGTPMYMSPEQADLSAVDVDTRSDVYSLGVLLYELLTGSTPFDKERLTQAGYDEFRRIICEEEPPRPSARLSTLQAGALSTISDRRQIEPRQLSDQLRGELDWIVMKALEKDRNRRYETANGFAMDVQRYLSDEPVQACPPSAVYRLKKFIRRNKTAMTLAGTVAVFLILAGGLGWSVRERAARHWLANQNVHAALETADARLADGNPYAPDLVTAVQKAEAQSDDGLVNAELRTRLDRIRSDLAMLVSLERARLEGDAGAGKGFDRARIMMAYAKAFQGYGIDVVTLPPDAAAARVRERTIALHLVAALDDWAELLLTEGRTKEAQHLLAVGSEADADPWRNRMRKALEANDSEALEELARGAPVDKMQPASLDLLGRNLLNAGRQPAAVALLEPAQRRSPADFWINMSLAKALVQGRPADAVGFFRACVALRPESPSVHLNLGFAMQVQEKLDEAIACCKEALRLKPDWGMACNKLVDVLLKAGRPDEALAISLEGLRWSPDYPIIRSNLGNALSAKGRVDEAIAAHREALRIAPNEPSIHSNLGAVLCDGKHDYDGAIASFREAIRLNPNLIKVYYNLGQALSKKGLVDEAIAAYREGLRIAPNDDKIHTNLGALLCDIKHDYDGAIASFREAIRLNPNVSLAHHNLGKALSNKGLWDEAITSYRESLRLNPDDPKPRLGIANTLRKMNRLDEAIVECRELLRLHPNHSEGHNILGAALSAKGLLDEAVKEFETAIRLEPNDFKAPYNLGVTLLKQGKPDDAIGAFERAIALKKDFAEFHLAMGKAQYEKGQPDRAIAAYEQAIALKPDLFAAHVDLGAAYLRTKQPEKALVSLRRAIALKKDDAQAQVNLGLALSDTGNYDEAREAFQKAHELAANNPGLAQKVAACFKKVERQQLLQNQLQNLVKVGQPQEFKGQLTKTAPLLDGKHFTTCPLELKAGQQYLIDLTSSEFNTDLMLMVKDASGNVLAEDDDGGQGTDSRLLFVPVTDGEYTIVVLAPKIPATGSYTLRIQLLGAKSVP